MDSTIGIPVSWRSPTTADSHGIPWSPKAAIRPSSRPIRSLRSRPKRPAFADTADWDPVGVDLSAYTSQVVQVRFRFGTDLYTIGEGWRIDDVVVSPRTEYGGWLTLPATNLTIDAGASSNLVLELDPASLPPMASGYLAIRIHHNDPEQTSPIVVPIALHNSTRRVRVTTEGNGQADPAGDTLLAAGEPFRWIWQPDAGSFIADIQTNSDARPPPGCRLHSNPALGFADQQSRHPRLSLRPFWRKGRSRPSGSPNMASPTATGWPKPAWTPMAMACSPGRSTNSTSNPTNPADARLVVNFVPQPEGSNDWRITWHAFTNRSVTYLVLSH